MTLPDHMVSALRTRVIREVPGDSGFRTSRAEFEYVRFALHLQDAGHDEDWIIGTLSELHAATRDEFSD